MTTLGMSGGRRLAAAAAVIATAGAGCGSAARSPAMPPHVLTGAQVGTLRAYGAGDTAFGLAVLSAVCTRQPGANVVLSPVSLATGLGMALLGARGQTAADMAKVLHLPAASGGQQAGLRARWALLRSLNRPGVTFSASNRIWADPSLSTRPRFAAALRAAYQAALVPVPLLSEPEQARLRINQSVARQTRGHIRELLPPGSLGQVGWVLTDALYLKARWLRPFNAALTQPGGFAAPGGRVTARYMTGGAFTTASDHRWVAAELPYQGGRLVMDAVLPPSRAGACPMPAAGTAAALLSRLGASKQVTDVALPTVKLTSSETLGDVLASLGMGLAFSARADFSGLSAQACCIKFVQHAATLNVAEKGTTASAATAVGVQPSAAHITLDFDRPYLLLLRDRLTGEPLMMAWVANPVG